MTSLGMGDQSPPTFRQPALKAVYSLPTCLLVAVAKLSPNYVALMRSIQLMKTLYKIDIVKGLSPALCMLLDKIKPLHIYIWCTKYGYRKKAGMCHLSSSRDSFEMEMHQIIYYYPISNQHKGYAKTQ